MAEDRPIRRTWRLLLGAFLLLGAVTAGRALTSGDALDWLPVLAVLIAALAAILHRNAVANLEARGRAEAESFARILQGLSRSVSVDAIVGAIAEDLADGTGADHAVVVRRRPEGDALEATIVSRRAGVPSSSTILPLSDLEAPPDRGPAAPIPIQVEIAGLVVAGSREPAMAGPQGPDRRTADANRAGSIGARGSAGAWAAAAGAAGSGWVARVLDDLGVAHPFRPTGPLLKPRSQVLGTGPGAAVTARIANRVRSVYGLSHTLAAPLRTEAGVIGAIVLSRRDREDWPDAARRFLEGAAVEAAAALARAYSYREVAAHASSDPLTGLPNRRYFDEFCGLLARRRRAGDAVAVLMVDIDKFKALNDTFGHPVGDEVLKAVAGAIVTAVRDEDVPARVGGEEFAVLLRNPGPEVAIEVGERVRAAVDALDLRRHGVAGVTVSVGVANARGADEPIPSIVERADRALLRAKRAGRNQVIAG